MKRQALRRMLSGFLAAVMVAALLPVTAMAVSEPGENSDQYKYAKSIQNELNEGIESDDMLYTLGGPYPLKDSDLYTYIVDQSYTDENTGTMISDTRYVIVPGIGGSDYNVPNYNNGNDGQPWAGTGSLSGIYIAEGVTGIGSYAFSGKTNVQKVEFQNASDLTYVGENAFSGMSSAAFTDEGNQDNPGTLNLSNVETLGSYAFSGCSQIDGVMLGGSITAVEEGEETPNKIPERAFSGVQLDTVTIPEGITEIGEGAFAGNRAASAISLPSTLVTIGDEAFACSITGNNQNVLALTIPEKVTSIGTNAFYGFTGMMTLTVESEVLTEVKNGAFGNNSLSAYYGEQTITGPDGTTTTVTMGTLIKTPNADIEGLFDNEVNCYTGPVSPLTLTNYQPAQCEQTGWRLYSYQYHDETKILRETLPALGINYDYAERQTISATCTEDAYYQYTCDRRYVEVSKGVWESVEHTHNAAIQPGQEGYQEATGHNYKVTAISDDGQITGSSGSTVTFVCQNSNHNPDHAEEQTVEILLKADAASGETQQTLRDVALPQVDGGTLEWDEQDTLLTYNNNEVRYFPVTFTPDPETYSYLVDADKNPVKASSVETTHLQVGVLVERQELDFSRIAFGGASNLVTQDGSRVEITVSGAPEEGISEPEIRYYNDSYSAETPPPRNAQWTGEVSVTYTYDASVYFVDPETEFVYGTTDAPYDIDVDEVGDKGTVTITHRYEIVYGDWSIVEAMALNPTYGDDAMETIRLLLVPAGTQIAWTYEGISGTSGSGSGTAQMEGEGNSIDIARIENAGDYRVAITLTNPSYLRGNHPERHHHRHGYI